MTVADSTTTRIGASSAMTESETTEHSAGAGKNTKPSNAGVRDTNSTCPTSTAAADPVVGERTVIPVTSLETLKPYLDEHDLLLLNFHAAFVPQCVDMNNSFETLSTRFPNVPFLSVDAETADDVADAYSIETVPTFVVIESGKVVDRLEGANAPELTKMVTKRAENLQLPASTGKARGDKNAEQGDGEHLDLEKLTRKHEVMLFMKGTPLMPQCGFSRQMVELLDEHKVKYGYFNIFADERVRQGLKEYSNWPTYPQLYYKGELLGGLDIIKDSIHELSLPVEESLQERLKGLTIKDRVVVFMKGDPEEPRCGFSRQIVDLLEEEGVEFGSVDVLQDDQVRQGMKEFSNWPTFPQVYVDGELIGGLDIVKEMRESGELRQVLEPKA